MCGGLSSRYYTQCAVDFSGTAQLCSMNFRNCTNLCSSDFGTAQIVQLMRTTLYGLYCKYILFTKFVEIPRNTVVLWNCNFRMHDCVHLSFWHTTNVCSWSFGTAQICAVGVLELHNVCSSTFWNCTTGFGTAQCAVITAQKKSL